jgi:hypothetical protein
LNTDFIIFTLHKVRCKIIFIQHEAIICYEPLRYMIIRENAVTFQRISICQCFNNVVCAVTDVCLGFSARLLKLPLREHGRKLDRKQFTDKTHNILLVLLWVL